MAPRPADHRPRLSTRADWLTEPERTEPAFSEATRYAPAPAKVQAVARIAEQLSTVNAISDALARTKRVQAPPELTAIKNRQAVALLSDALASVAGLERIVGKRQIAQVRRMQALVAEARAEIPTRRKCEGRPRPGRAPRRATNGRRQGSRRATGTGSRAGPSDDDGGSEPPRLRLWRHPRFGSCSPALLRVLLIGAGSSGAAI